MDLKGKKKRKGDGSRQKKKFRLTVSKIYVPTVERNTRYVPIVFQLIKHSSFSVQNIFICRNTQKGLQQGETEELKEGRAAEKPPGGGRGRRFHRAPKRRDESALAPTPPHPRLTPQLAGTHPTPTHAQASALLFKAISIPQRPLASPEPAPPPPQPT